MIVYQQEDCCGINAAGALRGRKPPLEGVADKQTKRRESVLCAGAILGAALLGGEGQAPHQYGEIMKNNFKWHKEQINGKWYSVCDHKHVPMIEHTKDGKYKIRNANGKAVLHEDYSDAVKLALEVYEKFKKFNRDFEE